jgi:hypothetical protein
LERRCRLADEIAMDIKVEGVEDEEVIKLVIGFW